MMVDERPLRLVTAMSVPSQQNEGFIVLDEFACRAVAASKAAVPSSRTVTLYRPVGPQELALIEASGWREFPPRLPEQPIFCPVLSQGYAAQIADDWNAKQSGAGYVTKFQIEAEFAARYPIQTVGAAVHQELWVPAEELAEFNRHIVGRIEVIAKFE